jgi:hypothetical protein
MKSTSLPVPTGHFRAVVGGVLGSNDQLYYRSLNDDELLRDLRRAASELHSTSVRMTEEVRQHLLPGLLVLRERYMQPGRRIPDPDRPTYYEVLSSLNLKPDTVRKWFNRPAGADVVLELLGESRKPIGRSRPRSDDSAAQLLLVAADKMAAELLKGNITAATRSAREYSEARNS